MSFSMMERKEVDRGMVNALAGCFKNSYSVCSLKDLGF